MKFALKVVWILAILAVPSFAENHGSQSGKGVSSSQGLSQAARCAQRVREAGCYLSGNDTDRIVDNVQLCKHVQSNKGTTHLEIFLLRNSDKLVVFQTKGKDVPDSTGRCPLVKYTVDASGIKDLKIIGNKTWMISNDGQLYVMMPDQQVFEVMNSKGVSYKGITEIKGVQGEPDSVRLVGKTFDATLSEEQLEGRKKSKLNFVKHFTFESLFRDK